MRKIIGLISLFLMIALVSGCALFVKPTIEKDVQESALVDLFDYTGTEVEQDTVLVQSHSLDTLAELLAPVGSRLVKTWPAIEWALVAVPSGKGAVEFAEELRGWEGIRLATPNMHYKLQSTTPTGALYRDQWGFQNIDAEAGWQITLGSSKVIIAIIDSGVDVDHYEFADKTFIGSYDATTGYAEMFDQIGHGTHVAGIAADDGRTGEMAGVAWNSPIMPIKIVDETYHVESAYVIEAFYYLGTYMRDHGDYRAVANFSYGSTEYDFAVKDAIDYAMEQGVTVVASAGNDGKRVINYPAAFNGVISVAASTPYDGWANFSTRGPWNSVAAPGVQILSTYLDSAYAWMNGTSMAAPFVSGAAALLLAQHPELSPLQVKNQIEQTAFGNGFTEELGYGILNIPAMLGPIKPMMYGGLEVQTNILPPTNETVPFNQGVLSILDSNQRLVTYGMTGEWGNCTFHALRPGSYTIQLIYKDPYQNKYSTLTRSTNVTVGGKPVVKMEVPVQY